MADLDDLLDSVSLDDLGEDGGIASNSNTTAPADGASGQSGGKESLYDGKAHPGVETFHGMCLSVLAKMNKLPPPACMNKSEGGEVGVVVEKLGNLYGEELLVDGIKSKLEGDTEFAGPHSKKLMILTSMIRQHPNHDNTFRKENRLLGIFLTKLKMKDLIFLSLLLVLLSQVSWVASFEAEEAQAGEAVSDPYAPPPSTTTYFVCTSSNPDLLGGFKPTGFSDGVSMFLNDEGMGVWRHAGFWYMGDYGAWPPETFYRCVVGCAEGLDEPPLVGYKVKRGVDSEKISLQMTKCEDEDGEL